MKQIKVYLNTVEDLTKALNEGKTLIDDNNNKYKKINSILVCFLPSGAYINGDILCVNQRKYYYEEKEPLKIEVGKFYKTRDGKKVICAYKSKSAKDVRPYFFSSVGGDEIFSMWTTGNGFCRDEEKTYKEDIVDYWED